MVRLGLSFWRPCLLSLPLASTLLLWQSLKYAHLHLARVAQAFPLCDSQEYWNDKTRHMYDALGQDGKWSLLCKDWGLNVSRSDTTEVSIRSSTANRGSAPRVSLRHT